MAKLYACQNFEWDGRLVFGSNVGRWGACEACGEMIDTRDWDRLVIRVIGQVRKRAHITFAELEYLSWDLRELYATMGKHLMARKTLDILQPKTAEKLC